MYGFVWTVNTNKHVPLFEEAFLTGSACGLTGEITYFIYWTIWTLVTEFYIRRLDHPVEESTPVRDIVIYQHPLSQHLAPQTQR